MATNFLHQSQLTSITSVLKKNHDVWVKNNLPRSRGATGPILINMKEPEGEAFVVEIGPGKATNLSVQASDKAMQTSTELRKLIHSGDIVVLTTDDIGELTEEDIHRPGEYLENPHILSDKPVPNTVENLHIDDIHPRLNGMAGEFEMLIATLGDDATPESIEEIQVSRMMDELMGLSDVLTKQDFAFIKQKLTHPTILDWVTRYLKKNTPRG